MDVGGAGEGPTHCGGCGRSWGGPDPLCVLPILDRWSWVVKKKNPQAELIMQSKPVSSLLSRSLLQLLTPTLNSYPDFLQWWTVIWKSNPNTCPPPCNTHTLVAFFLVFLGAIWKQTRAKAEGLQSPQRYIWTKDLRLGATLHRSTVSSNTPSLWATHYV